MRYSELAGKEIIDIAEGRRLGVINDTDLIIDSETGKVLAIVLPDYPRRGLFRFFGRPAGLTIPWSGVKKIGVDLIIVDLSVAKIGSVELGRKQAKGD